MHLITMSTDLKLSKAQISKIIQPGGFLGQSFKEIYYQEKKLYVLVLRIKKEKEL